MYVLVYKYVDRYVHSGVQIFVHVRVKRLRNNSLVVSATAPSTDVFQNYITD